LLARKQRRRRRKARRRCDKLLPQLVGAAGQHPVDENIAQVAHVLQRLRAVQFQGLTAIDTHARKRAAAGEILSNLK
jgi:hypothetical protein